MWRQRGLRNSAGDLCYGESCGQDTQWAGALYYGGGLLCEGRQTHTHRHPQDGDTGTKGPTVTKAYTSTGSPPQCHAQGSDILFFAVCSTCISWNVWIRKETYSEGLF